MNQNIQNCLSMCKKFNGMIQDRIEAVLKHRGDRNLNDVASACYALSGALQALESNLSEEVPGLEEYSLEELQKD